MWLCPWTHSSSSPIPEGEGGGGGGGGRVGGGGVVGRWRGGGRERERSDVLAVLGVTAGPLIGWDIGDTVCCVILCF
jgi:hypothetical protein